MCCKGSTFQLRYRFLRRGAQKAHRAVPNEALYGVLRISRLITWTYLHFFQFFVNGIRPRLESARQTLVFPTMLSFCPFQNAANVHFKLLGCTHFKPFDGVSLLLLFCTFDKFQIMNSNGFSIQVCGLRFALR